MSHKEITDTYSATMRRLNKEDPEKAKEFMIAFKEAFDDAMDQNIDDGQSVALLQAKEAIASDETNRIIKMAQTMIASKKNPAEVGMALANIIKILMEKLPHDRKSSLENMRNKISRLNPNEIALSAMPETAAYGQSITLIKTLLNGYSPEYIKQVISATTQALY